MTERECLEVLKNKSSTNQAIITKTKEQQTELDKKKCQWVVFFRKNINLYIQYVLGVGMFPFQHYCIYTMSEADTMVDVSTRGVSKTWKAVLYGIAKCMLYPAEKVGIAAVTRSQADEDFQTTFLAEIVMKSSPLLRYFWEQGLITSKETEKGYAVTFWNGSMMYFFPCIDSSRGLHCSTLIIEECRLIKKSMVDSIVIPMATQRQPIYKSKSEYVMRRDLDEPVQIIYITSNRYANEWFNTMYNKTFMSYYTDRYNNHRVFNSDIFLAIKYGLKKASWFLAQKKTMDELNFRMELLNETCGEVDGAYFTLEMFQKNQILKDCFIAPNIQQFNNNIIKNRKKGEDEIRMLFIDFAFASTYKGGTENDNTVIGCMAITKRDNGKYYRLCEHIETHGGSETDYVLRRIRELYFDYEADYIVMDNRSGGEVLYVDLTREFIHPERTPDKWNSHGFTVANERDYHVVADGKLEDMRQRTIDPNAIPCIIPITASQEFNSLMWQDLNQKLRNEEICLLIDDLEYQTRCAEDKKYFNLTSEEKAQRQIPYIQTMLLINEAVNLTQEWRNGLLKLTEPRSGYKDRIVSFAYANYIATKIITNLEKKSQQNQTIDYSQLQLVF